MLDADSHPSRSLPLLVVQLWYRLCLGQAAARGSEL